MFNKKPNPSQKHLRSFGVNVPDMVSRHGSTDGVVAKVGETVAEVASSYVTSLDGLRKQRLATREVVRAGRTRVDELLGSVRMWRKAFGRSGVTFEAADLERVADDPKEVLAYAVYLIELARERTGTLPYAEAMIADLESHLEPARNAWHAAHLERVALKGVQREVREKGHAFSRSVMQLRAVLEKKLGPDHPDCLLLKVRRTKPSAEDDDVAEATKA
jgi:hypothetical protein